MIRVWLYWDISSWECVCNSVNVEQIIHYKDYKTSKVKYV